MPCCTNPQSFLKILPVRFDYSTLADQVLKFAKALRGGPTEGLERLAVITHMYNMGDRCVVLCTAHCGVDISASSHAIISKVRQ